MHTVIEKGNTWFPGPFRVPRLFCRPGNKIQTFFLGPDFPTIAKFQWFYKAPLPLNGIIGGNHWFQRFFYGFGVRQPLVSMVFNGCPLLVWPWNGYIYHRWCQITGLRGIAFTIQAMHWSILQSVFVKMAKCILRDVLKKWNELRCDCSGWKSAEINYPKFPTPLNPHLFHPVFLFS